MKSKFLMLCIAGFMFLLTGCNNNAGDKKKDGADTATGTNDKITNSDLPANDPSPAPVTNKTDYSYDASVTISGKISKETFYGSPGFGENPQTDEKEERYLLVLDKPINVIGDTNPEDDSKESKYNV